MGRGDNYLLALGCEKENIAPGVRSPGGATDLFPQRNIAWWQGGAMPVEKAHPIVNRVFDGMIGTGLLADTVLLIRDGFAEDGQSLP